jgi:hypothetical protein
MTSSQNPHVNDRASHARFLELCALETSGSLETSELVELKDHLATCAECRSLLADYRTIVETSIPQLADTAGFEPAVGFDREIAETKKSLFSRLDQSTGAEAEDAGCESGRAWWPMFRPFVHSVALVLMALGIGVVGYVFGGRHSGAKETTGSAPNELEARLSETGKEREVLEAKLAQQEKTLRHAAIENGQQLREIGRLKDVVASIDAARSNETSAMNSLSKENVLLKADHDGMSRRLQEAQVGLAQLQQQLDQSRSEQRGFEAENLSQRRRIEELTAQISEQQRLLRADRDIRDLMGARDLLISDVIDVDTKGRSKKPFGRIFYTKNKSLVFYAFDLDKQPGLRNTSAFQAWGARATSKGNESPMSMGLFYMDNATAKRWVLKLDNPKLLGQIDSVFVTVEPAGGSNKPSGKQLLFAYLRGEANHP